MTGWRAACSKRTEGCTWTIDAFTEDAARQAGRKHYRTVHVVRTPIVHPTWPYRGKPNRTQLRLLRLAAAGQLLGYTTRIYHMAPGMSVDLADPSASLGPPLQPWVPLPLKGNIQKWVPGLIAAGLLRDPKPSVSVSARYLAYRVTPEGHRLLAREGVVV